MIITVLFSENSDFFFPPGQAWGSEPRSYIDTGSVSQESIINSLQINIIVREQPIKVLINDKNSNLNIKETVKVSIQSLGRIEKAKAEYWVNIDKPIPFNNLAISQLLIFSIPSIYGNEIAKNKDFTRDIKKLYLSEIKLSKEHTYSLKSEFKFTLGENTYLVSILGDSEEINELGMFLIKRVVISD